MKAKILTGLDIGTHSVKMAVLQRREEEGDLEILGFGEEPSSGVRKGQIVNPEETSKGIAALKSRLENISGQKIEEAVCSIGGSHLFVVPSHGIVAVSRADNHISQEDIDRVLQAAQAFSLPSNKEILEIFPQHFVVDGGEPVKEVVGMKGVRLEADVLAVCGFSPYIKNLTDAVLGAGIEIVDIIPSSLMSSPCVLTRQQKELGVAVLDLGAGTTGLSVYEEGDLIHTAVFPIGSENITNDIAIGLRCEPDVAERVKLEFGTCPPIAGGKGRKMEKIELADGDHLVFSQKLLSHIIGARIKEIFQLVNKELKDISKQATLPGGVVLVGGGAKLPKIVESAKKDLRLTVKHGAPHGVQSVQSDPAFLGAMGLAQMAVEETVQPPKRKIEFRFFKNIKKWARPFIP